MNWNEFVQLAKKLCAEVNSLLQKGKSKYKFDIEETTNCNIRIWISKYRRKEETVFKTESGFYAMDSYYITRIENNFDDNLQILVKGFIYLIEECYK